MATSLRDQGWTKVQGRDLELAKRLRDRGLAKLVFNSEGWWYLPIPSRPADGQEVPRPTRPLQRTPDGKYVTNHVQCRCGEQYLAGMTTSHERNSIRHRQWLRGDIEVPVPEQPPVVAFSRGEAPRMELGGTMICRRCKARHRKGLEDFGYFLDPRSSKTNPFPCQACNGHGIVPNKGPQ